MYSEEGFEFRTNGLVRNSIGDVKVISHGFFDNQDIYYKDKLIEKNGSLSDVDEPYVHIIDRFGKENYLNYKTGTFLLPKNYDSIGKTFEGNIIAVDEKREENVSVFNAIGLFRKEDIEENDIHTLYSQDGRELYSGPSNIVGVYKDLFIHDNGRNSKWLYSREGKKYNGFYFSEYTIYNDKLYTIKDYEPFVYNRDKNTFEKTDICYLTIKDRPKKNTFICVYQNGKFGIICDDFKTPIIYDDVYSSSVNGLFFIRQGDKIGLIGKDVNIPCVYSSLKFNVDFYEEDIIKDLFIVGKNKENRPFYLNGFKRMFTTPEKEKEELDNMAKTRDNQSNLYFTVVDSKGKELLPCKYTSIKITHDVIIARESISDKIPDNNGPCHIYDHKGMLKMVINTAHDILINDRLLAINYNEYLLDLKTLKKYKSLKDYLIETNFDNELIKDSDVFVLPISANNRHFYIRYKKPFFSK